MTGSHDRRKRRRAIVRRRHSPDDCPVCSATRTDIRRAVEATVVMPPGPDKISPTVVIQSAIQVSEKVIAWLKGHPQ